MMQRVVRRERHSMTKTEQAQSVLRAIGMPTKQQNEVSALTLLALANLRPRTAWREAERRLLRIHDLLQFCGEVYKKEYAENTREVFRRQVMHQFEHARLVDRNPDDPSRPTNSGLTCYALTKEFLKAVRTFGTAAWPTARDEFISEQGLLREKYERRRQRQRVPVQVANGRVLELSPGRHNELQARIVEDFGAEFAPGATLLYLGDTAKKMLYLDEPGLEALGVPVTEHEKLPDVVLYDGRREWLYLIEAATSHGRVTPKRRHELEMVLSDCPAGRVYVSAFLTIAHFRRWLRDIAWETEVWIAENPSHMIHYNGDRFIGPR